MEDKKEDVISIEMTYAEFLLMVHEIRHLGSDKKSKHFVSRMLCIEQEIFKKFGIDYCKNNFDYLHANTVDEINRKYIAYSVRHPDKTPFKKEHQEIIEATEAKIREIKISLLDRENGYEG